MNKNNFRTHIIALAGRKRSGKTELATFLQEEYGAVIVTIASYLKQLCCELLECDLQQLLLMKDNGTTFSKTVTKKWVDIIHNKAKIDKEIIINEIGGITFTDVRQMLQVIGTNLIRQHNPNWHIEQMVNEINSFDKNTFIVIDDVRFPNEKEAIEQLGGEVIFIIRTHDCLNISNHLSEISLSWKDFDDKHVIFNENTISELKNKFFGWFKQDTEFLEHKLKEYSKNSDFGLELNDDVIDVVNYIKTNGEVFNNLGIIKHNGHAIYNPYITENIKRWL